MKTIFHQAMEAHFPVTLAADYESTNIFIQFLNSPSPETPFGSSFAESPVFKGSGRCRWLFLSACSAKRLEEEFGLAYSQNLQPRSVKE